jgi:hypothetical protein
MPRSSAVRRLRRPRLLIAAVVAAALLALTATRAHAGTYTVHTCTTPTGIWTGMGGWTSSASAPAVGHDNGSATPCSSAGGSFSLQFGASGLTVAPGSWVAWDFTAPAGTTIASYTFVRAYALAWPAIAGSANRPYAYQAWHDADANSGLLEFQAPSQSGQTLTQAVPVAASGTTSGASLHISLQCWALVGSLDCGSFPAQVTIPRATIGLTDTETPTTSVSGGSLFGSAPVRGTANVLFHASDVGAGVYRAIVTVDGAEVARRVVDANGGQCADVDPGNDDPYEFGTPQPCPLDAAGEVQLDTRSLHDGSHVVRVAVEDAAGNVDVIHEGTVTTHNAPVNTAAPTISGSLKAGATLTAATGHWDGAPTSWGYRWLRCDAAGSACSGIAGADGVSYALTPADAYHRIVAEVTAENASGAAVARSAASGPVADLDGHVVPPTSPGGASAGGSTSGGISGLANPLAALPGHVANGATPVGRPRVEIAFQLAGGRNAHRVVSPRSRGWRIAGRLLDGGGHGIAGARLTLAWQVAGGRWHTHGNVRSGADGRFTVALAPGPTRVVKLVYFAFSDSRAFVTSNVLHEDVVAPLTIQAAPRRLTGARVVRLSGRVGGASIPAGGLLVTLEGYQTGYGWRTFRTVRTTRGGRWSTRYRFRLAHGRFGFRAVLPRQSGFPFITSRSRAVSVVVS